MQQLGEKPVISTATKTPGGAAAPWLQPAKTNTASTQPWMANQAVGAPGTADVPPPPGTQPTGAPVLGSTPATAFPPPVAPGGAYGGYQQTQAWDQWNNGYYNYGAWDQSAAAAATSAAPGTEYQQQYGHYGPSSAVSAAQPNAAADYSAYGYQYQSHPPQ
jgi:hypothetical protein